MTAKRMPHLSSGSIIRLHCAVSRSPLFKRSSTTAAKDEKKTIEEVKGSQSLSKRKAKSQAELDKELQERMAGIAGDGGEAGIELEDGQPVAMKRSVKDNMFRYI